MMNTPVTRIARQARILELLNSHRIESQHQLSEFLREEGITITQATLSRDLDELGARKIRPDDGRAFYSVAGSDGAVIGVAPQEKLRRMVNDLVIGVDSSANIAVLRTPPGGAQYLASFIDRVSPENVVGTIAGDDTVFVLARDPMSGRELAEILTKR